MDSVLRKLDRYIAREIQCKYVWNYVPTVALLTFKSVKDYNDSLVNYSLFIEVASNRWGSRYSYAEVGIEDFSTMNKECMIKVFCWKHKDFYINMFDHIEYGCPYCHILLI